MGDLCAFPSYNRPISSIEVARKTILRLGDFDEDALAGETGLSSSISGLLDGLRLTLMVRICVRSMNGMRYCRAVCRCGFLAMVWRRGLNMNTDCFS